MGKRGFCGWLLRPLELITMEFLFVDSIKKAVYILKINSTYNAGSESRKKMLPFYNF
jgi:hypothetical protein